MNLHKFWNNEPIINFNDKNIQFNKDNCPIQIKDIDSIRKLPYNLPTKENVSSSLIWYQFDLEKESDLDLFTNFLNKYYGDDNSGNFKLTYPKYFLKWFICQPGYYKDLIIGIKHNNDIVATIVGIPIYVNVFKYLMKQVEINFLCIDKVIRGYGLAPLLIKEVTRRTNLHDIWQAIYTTDLNLPNNLCKISYYHRNINTIKLLETSFCTLDNNKLEDFLNFNKINDPLKLIKFERLTINNARHVCHMLNDYLKKYNIFQFFSYEQFIHHFLDNDYMYSYITIEDKVITNFISFYVMPNKIINNKSYDKINKAYLYYYFNYTESLFDIVSNILIIIKNLNIDVIDCLDIFDYKNIFNDLHFTEGNGHINYYLYNWKCPQITNNMLGLSMV